MYLYGLDIFIMDIGLFSPITLILYLNGHHYRIISEGCNNICVFVWYGLKHIGIISMAAAVVTVRRFFSLACTASVVFRIFNRTNWFEVSITTNKR